MTELATQRQPLGLREMLELPSVRSGISAALGGFMEEDNFLSQMLIAFQAPGIIDCTIDSKFKAAHVCATLGLLPTLQQVALIPRGDSRDRNAKKEVTVMPQWQGFQALMLRHQDVLSVKGVLVHSSDRYEYDPETEAIKHMFDPFDASRTFKTMEDVRGGYLVVKFRDGRQPIYHYVTVETIIKARDCSKKPHDKTKPWIWDQWFYEQCLKTVYRNAYARRVVPIDPFAIHRLQSLLETEDVAIGNDPNRLSSDPVAAIKYTPQHKPKSRTEAAAQKMKKPVEPEAEIEPPAKTSKTKAAKEVPFDVQIVQAETPEAVEAIFKAIEAAGLTAEEVTFYRNLGIKRIESITK